MLPDPNFSHTRALGDVPRTVAATFTRHVDPNDIGSLLKSPITVWNQQERISGGQEYGKEGKRV